MFLHGELVTDLWLFLIVQTGFNGYQVLPDQLECISFSVSLHPCFLWFFSPLLLYFLLWFLFLLWV